MRGDKRGRRICRTGVVIILALLTSCGEPSGEQDTTEPTGPDSAVASPAEPDGTASTVVDPEHAMDPPGEVETPLLSADIMVIGNETLAPGLVKRISRLEGVAATTTISLKQVPIENRLYDIAAVDPAEYRRFTEARSAQFQPQWDRLAGGEIAGAEELQKRLPLDADGYLSLDVATDSPRIHVGAYAPQVPTIELVVNAKWGETLGIDQRNALVISTQPTSPQSMQGPIRRLVGDAGSVQMMDIASRLGLDPEAAQTARPGRHLRRRRGHLPLPGLGRSGDPRPGLGARAHRHRDRADLGPGHLQQGDDSRSCRRRWATSSLADWPTRSILASSPAATTRGSSPGRTQLSNHAFGLALDINVPGNQRGTVGEMDRGVVDAFKKWGFGWGGDWNYTDPMHFELNRIVNPG